MRIGIVCYPTFGGSGIIATEIGLGMARRGHEVHFVTTGRPARLEDLPGVHLHPVQPRDYPVFPTVPYSLALASKLVDVTRTHGLDLVHAHYAVPHATAAWMAREVLGGDLPLITTLHGTDITLVGSDPTYLPITRHSIAASDRLTSPSRFLADETHARFDLDPTRNPIQVLPNFVDTERFRPGEGDRLAGLFGEPGPTLVHVSNFRALKRVDRVVDILDRQEPSARLLLIGDGPERAGILAQVERRGLTDRVRWLGEVEGFADLLREADVFVLPSETESFGLAALEALASGVPVVASDVGGLPEVVRHGETGFLEADVAAMATRVAEILADPDRRHGMRTAAREDVERRFRRDPMIEAYADVYAELTGLRS
jgi:N-acetyl-alpha-D-glucosaminyl L-malate synthase BshA